MTPVHDVQLHMAARMNAALASEGPSAALLCFIEDLEEFGLLGSESSRVDVTESYRTPLRQAKSTIRYSRYSMESGWASDHVQSCTNKRRLILP
jgi:hypothetical protein